MLFPNDLAEQELKGHLNFGVKLLGQPNLLLGMLVTQTTNTITLLQ
jgi:hypothetical protein